MAATLSAAQECALRLVRQRGYLTDGSHGVRLDTMQALERAGLVTLKVTTHNKWFGSSAARTRITTEWVAHPVQD